MSDKNLLILITRITGEDEWGKVWKFPANDFITFIRSNNVTHYSFVEFEELNLAAHLDADAWILRGYDYEAEKIQAIHAALNKIDWQKQKVTMKIHRGGAKLIANADFQPDLPGNEYPNTQALFKQAVDYSIGNKILDSNPIVRFARGLKQRLTDAEYKANLRSAILPMPLHVQIANTMHHLSYVLQPLDIDFQGLQDTDFQLEYWRELTEDYKNDKALGKLDQTKALIYGQLAGADNTVETVLREANDLYQRGPWEHSWEELQQNLVPREGLPEEFNTILPLMENGSEENLRTIKKYFSGGRNPIHEWVTNVHKTLGEVRDALSERETVPRKQSN